MGITNQKRVILPAGLAAVKKATSAMQLLGGVLCFETSAAILAYYAHRNGNTQNCHRGRQVADCGQIPASTPNAILIQTGRDIGVQSILTGRQHPILQRAAEEHAAYQARVGVQGHQGWERRVAALMRAMPNCHEFREVANESWPGQDTSAAAKEMYRSWRLSPGHWSAVNGHCSYYGYAMVLGRNGVWYACGIFADLR